MGSFHHNFFETFEDAPFLSWILTYFGLGLLVLVGYIDDFLRSWGIIDVARREDPLDRLGFSHLYPDYDSFFTRNLYRKSRDCWNRPIGSCPGAVVDVLEREEKADGWGLALTGRKIECLNVASYNYLGFAQQNGPITDQVKESIRKFGTGIGSSRQEMGSLDLHRRLESLFSRFLGVEDSLVFTMGFATNALNIPALVGPGNLILSDELNHCSLVLGARLTGAKIQTFKHGGKTFIHFQFIYFTPIF